MPRPIGTADGLVDSSTSMAKPRYRYFGTLRFVLAFFVMFAHFVNNIASPSTRDAFFPLALGNIAVLVFFVLSGFIIVEAVNDSYRDRTLPFATNRLLRIVPPYLAALIVTVAIHYTLLRLGMLKLYYPGSFAEGDFSPHALAVNALSIFPGFTPHDEKTFIGIAWAVRTELQFYLIAACALAGAQIGAKLMRLRSERIFIWLMLAAAALHMALYMAWAAGRAPATFSFGPYFILGGAIYYAGFGSKRATALAILMFPFVAHQFLTYSLPSLGEYQVDMTTGPAITPIYQASDLILLLGLICAVAVLARVVIPALRTTDRFLGELSYPLYLNHPLGGVLAASFIPDWGDRRMMLAFVSALGVSYALYVAVEPMLKRVRNTVRGHPIE
jgi:peptidoglycan/LPS O-acetylase OafA/YrhL